MSTALDEGDHYHEPPHGPSQPHGHHHQPPAIPKGLLWLHNIILGYRAEILDQPFFDHVRGARSAEELRFPRHLLVHSRTFPLLLQHRVTSFFDHPAANPTNDPSRPKLLRFFGRHVAEEKGHADMLTRWLHAHDLVFPGEDAAVTVPTIETTACLAHCYMVVDTGTPWDTLVVLNALTEGASCDLFRTVTPEIQGRLGLRVPGNAYWDIHCEADEFHSTEGLVMIPETDPDSPAGQQYTLLAWQAAMYWGAMLNSWVGIPNTPPKIPAPLLTIATS